jgi:transporter family protein
MVFAGITAVLAKFGMKDVNSDTALLVRTFVVLVFVTFNAFLFKDAATQLKQISISSFALLSLSALATTFSWVFYYRAMKEGPVSYVASIDKASIVITLIFSFILFKEPVTPKVLLGAGLIFAGMLVLVWK